MHKAINKNAHMILSFRPWMMKLLPSRNVTLVPVSITLYFAVSPNISFALAWILSRIFGNRLLPTSAMFTLMRACCFELSMKLDTSFVNEFLLRDEYVL